MSRPNAEIHKLVKANSELANLGDNVSERMQEMQSEATCVNYEYWDLIHFQRKGPNVHSGPDRRT